MKPKAEITLDTSPRPLWEKMPNETPAAFKLFKIYRDMGLNRSFIAVTRETGSKTASNVNGQISDYAARYNWKERAGAWDGEQDRIELLSRIDRIRMMNLRQSTIAGKLLDKLEKAISFINPRKIGLANYSRLLEAAAKIERISLGEASENIAFKGALITNGTAPSMTDEERKRLESEFKGIIFDIRGNSKAK